LASAAFRNGLLQYFGDFLGAERKGLYSMLNFDLKAGSGNQLRSLNQKRYYNVFSAKQQKTTTYKYSKVSKQINNY